MNNIQAELSNDSWHYSWVDWGIENLALLFVCWPFTLEVKQNTDYLLNLFHIIITAGRVLKDDTTEICKRGKSYVTDRMCECCLSEWWNKTAAPELKDRVWRENKTKKTLHNACWHPSVHIDRARVCPITEADHCHVILWHLREKYNVAQKSLRGTLRAELGLCMRFIDVTTTDMTLLRSAEEALDCGIHAGKNSPELCSRPDVPTKLQKLLEEHKEFKMLTRNLKYQHLGCAGCVGPSVRYGPTKWQDLTCQNPPQRPQMGFCWFLDK